MNILKSLITGGSKKLYVVLGASLLVVFKDYFAFSPDQIEALEILAGSYLVGQGVADMGKGKALIETKKD